MANTVMAILSCQCVVEDPQDLLDLLDEQFATQIDSMSSSTVHSFPVASMYFVWLPSVYLTASDHCPGGTATLRRSDESGCSPQGNQTEFKII